MNYLLVGAGIHNITLARLLADAGKSVRIIEQRSQIGGNCHDQERDGILIHSFGPHLFRTNNEEVWRFLSKYTKWHRYVHRVKSLHQGKLYSFPPNERLYQALGTKDHQVIFDKFFRGYSQKQWGKMPDASVINRIKWRDSADDRYSLDKHQAMPLKGYTAMFRAMLEGIPVELNTTFDPTVHKADVIVYTGDIARLLGKKLPYRSLSFRLERIEEEDYQGHTQINYADLDVPWTRSIEWKHIYQTKTPYTYVTFEKSASEGEPFYPIAGNEDLYRQMKSELLELHPNIIPAGRLGSYQYRDMDVSVAAAMSLAKRLLNGV